MNYENEIKNKNILEKWIDDLGLYQIRVSDPLERIKRVRFLGTMLYTKKLNYHFSRYEHSLYVAKLAYRMAEKFELPDDLKKTVVIMALIHDIGHLPFSHASEVFFRQNWGKYHTGHGSRLAQHLSKSLKLNGQHELSKLILAANALLNNRYDLKSKALNKYINEIFHGVLSADTLDGINRAAISIGRDTVDPLSIVEAMSIQNGMTVINYNALPTVFNFLKLKEYIYINYVYSTAGMAAEAMLTRALEQAFPESTDKNDFLALDDDSTLERMKDNEYSNKILKKLESRELYYSMREASNDKYNMTYDLLKKNNKDKNFVFVSKKIENEFKRQLNISDPTKLIFHSTIKLKFTNCILKQIKMFDLPLSFSVLKKEYGTKKTYGESTDVFYSKDLIHKIKYLSPFNIDIEKMANEEKVRPRNKSKYIEKHSGAYMTPPIIAEFLVNWAISSSNQTVLDPASGEGVFLEKALDRYLEIGSSLEKIRNLIFGAESEREYFNVSLKKLKKRTGESSFTIYNKDFFYLLNDKKSKFNKTKFDAIVGNPPYINFHRFQNSAKDISCELVHDSTQIVLSKRISSWAPYLICASEMLKPSGRLAMVLPFEFLTTDYAQPVREYIRQKFKSFTIVFFNKYIFPSVQQEILLLLASNDKDKKIGRIELKDTKELNSNAQKKFEEIRFESKWGAKKWTNFLTNSELLCLVDELIRVKKICEFGNILDISIGLVTGKNDYFTLNKEDIKNNKIKDKWIVPIITKSKLIKGAIFNYDDYKRCYDKNKKCSLLRIQGIKKIDKDRDLYIYLENGKILGIDQGYKCRTRWPWYSVPMKRLPEGFLTYMSGRYVRAVLNEANVHSTNTIHNFDFKNDVPVELKKAYISSFYSSLSMLSTELIGRSYGGGVLKLEIGEAKKVLLPNLKLFHPNLTNKLSDMLVKIDHSIRNEKEDIFYEIDDIVLNEGLGINADEIDLIQKETAKLRKRRILK